MSACRQMFRGLTAGSTACGALRAAVVRVIPSPLFYTLVFLVPGLDVCAGPAEAQGDSITGQLFSIPSRSRVVVLHSYHHSFSWTDHICDGIHSAFAPYPEQVELCVEYMDTRRIASDDYFQEFARFLKLKYANRPIDVMLCSDDHAFNFMMTYGDSLFPDVPLVFCSVSGFEPVMRDKRPMTGLQESIDIRATIEAALRLHPDTRRVHVILDGSRTGRALKRAAGNVFDNFTDRVSFRYLEFPVYEQLAQHVASLDEGDLVFVFIFPPDSEGRVLSHEVNLQRLAPLCMVPMYGVWQFYLGAGIVGGKLADGHAEGRMASHLCLRILSGEDAASIPVGRSPTRFMFDDRQLRFFDIDRSRLPENAVVVNEPYSLFREHRLLVSVSITVFIVLLILVVLLLTNVARRRRTEIHLREYGERLNLALSSAEEGVWELDAKTNRVMVNRRWATMLGYAPEEVDPSFSFHQSLVHPDDLPIIRRSIDDNLSGRNEFFDAEYRVRARSGEWIWVYDRGKVVQRDNSGKPLRIIGVRLDISARKRAREKERELERQVQHTQKLESLGVLAGGIAHDFNNLLTGILGNANLALLDLPAESPSRECLTDIETASRRAADLCRQMLAYSGKGKFVIEPIDVGRLVREMSHLLEVSISKKVRLHYDFAEDLPPILADATQIRQIVMNLITNASDAIGDSTGTITISTGLQHCSSEYLRSPFISELPPPGNYVYLEVADTGSGMDHQTKLRLFDPFFTTKFTGRGLGLSAVLGIVRGHHGAVRIYSEPGKGSTFKVLFPEQKLSENHVDTAEQKREPASVPTTVGTGTVLVVDDDDTVRLAAERMIARMGFTTITARDGQEAVELFKKKQDEILCVLLDLTMPTMDGVECFQELRKLRPDVKVILSSGYNEQDATQRFTGRGLAGFVQKPYQYDLLAGKLRELLSGGGG